MFRAERIAHAKVGPYVQERDRMPMRLELESTEEESMA